MKNNSFLKIFSLILGVVLLFGLFVRNSLAQTEEIPLPSAETVINKKCGSSAEIVLARGYTTGKVAHVYLLLEGKYFTQAYLKRFFTCISREYTDIVVLKITALSDRKELDIEIDRFVNYPGDEDPPPTPKYNPNPEPPNYYRAYYEKWSVLNEIESFRYSPDPQKWKLITYNLRKPIAQRIK